MNFETKTNICGEFKMEDNWKLVHIGIPVFDLEKAIKNYRSLGAASFKEIRVIDSSCFAEYLVYGKTPNPTVTTRAVDGRMGSLGIELLQTVQGETVHKEFLEKNGEGVGHIAYEVENLDDEVARMVEKGFDVILSFKTDSPNPRRGVYIDTRDRFSNLITELIQAS